MGEIIPELNPEFLIDKERAYNVFAAHHSQCTQRQQYLGNTICPVCSKLAFHFLDAEGHENPISPIPSLEYTIDLETLSQEDLAVWADECSLVRLVRDLNQSGFQSTQLEDSKSWSIMEIEKKVYDYTCTRMPPGWHTSGRVLCGDSESILHHRFTESYVDSNPLSRNTVAKMQRWLEHCDKWHKGCKTNNRRLPTRLLDLQDFPLIRLVELDSNHEYEKYVALSHCWGPSPGFLTTKSSIVARKAGFEVDEAPATFKDAVLVTRALGIQYLWIDSLCIIQGDPEDWAREASRMASVYSHSYLMIQAASSDDDRVGFLEKRNITDVPFTIRSKGGLSSKYYFRRERLLWDYPRRPFDTNCKIEPTDTRAWTFQEEYLAKRMIRFGSDGIAWECTGLKLHETSTDFSRWSHWQKAHKALPEDLRQWGKWYKAVLQFSRRTLTYDTDKLLSLVGIITEIGSHTQPTEQSDDAHRGKYYAGIWWDNLPSGLLWMASLDSERNTQLSKTSRYLSPTWSWQSLNGPVEYSIKEGESYNWKKPDCVSFLDVNLKSSASPPYWDIQEGSWLKLRAPLLPVKLLSLASDYIPPLFKFSKLPSSNAEITAYFDLPQPSLELKIWALLLMQTRDKLTKTPQFGQPPNAPVICGILVQKSDRYLDGYERVGFFQTEYLTNEQESEIFGLQPSEEVMLY